MAFSVKLDALNHYPDSLFFITTLLFTPNQMPVTTGQDTLPHVCLTPHSAVNPVKPRWTLQLPSGLSTPSQGFHISIMCHGSVIVPSLLCHYGRSTCKELLYISRELLGCGPGYFIYIVLPFYTHSTTMEFQNLILFLLWVFSLLRLVYLFGKYFAQPMVNRLEGCRHDFTACWTCITCDK